MKGFWTHEKTRQLFALRVKGHTQKEIALELGCSSNAVAGKLHRLGLRMSPIERGRRQGPMKGRVAKNAPITLAKVGGMP